MMNNSPQNQQGVTLLVALVILILVSLIGVIALKNAAVEEQMSSNLYQKNLTFQASESAVESTLDDVALLSSALSSTSAQEQDVAVPIPNTSATVNYMFVGEGPAEGYSQGTFAGARIMITSTGQIAATNARTTTVHGVVRIVPDVD